MNARVTRHPWVVATAVGVTLLAGTTISTAGAAPDPGAAGAASAWLAGQLEPDGTVENPNTGALPDHGLMIDVLLAMVASGDEAGAEPIVELLDDEGHATDYYTLDGLVPTDDGEFLADITAGSVAKVLVAALAMGRDPHDFDGADLVAETVATIVTDDVRGATAGFRGRIADYTKDPAHAAGVLDSANLFGQALAVIGLAGAGESFADGQPAELATEALLDQQCDEGWFRVFWTTAPFVDAGSPAVTQRTETCDEAEVADEADPDGDTTAIALSALLAAREAGATGLDGPIADAVAWLVGAQDASGGWGGGVSTAAPNANSTGLIVQALAEARGDATAVADGVAYLQRVQVDAGADVGAIAYNEAAFADALTGGITGLDQWIRATAQASLGLAQVGFSTLVGLVDPGPGEPGATTTTTAGAGSSTTSTTVGGGSSTTSTTGVGGATVSSGSARPGDQLTVSAPGFTAGESVAATVHSTPVAVGTATTRADGTVTHTFTVPTGIEPGTHRVELVGATSGRVASAQFQVLAPTGGSTSSTSTTARAGTGRIPRTGSDAGDLAALALALTAAGVLVTRAGAVRRQRAAS